MVQVRLRLPIFFSSWVASLAPRASNTRISSEVRAPGGYLLEWDVEVRCELRVRPVGEGVKSTRWH
jgi:hypothetical protein